MTHAPLVVRGPDILPAVIPHLVGFHPLDSVVVLGLAPGTRAVRVTVRVDLPGPDADIDDVLEAWSSGVLALLRVGALEAVVAVFPGPEEDPWAGEVAEDLPRGALVDALLDELTDAGIETLDAVCIVGHRLRSYRCADATCCPREGREADTTDWLRVNAAFVAQGSAPLESRRALVETLAPRERAESVVLSVDAARDGVVLRLPAGATVKVAQFVADLRSWSANPRNGATLVRLVVIAGFLTASIRTRDLLLRSLTLDHDHGLLGAARQVLSEAVRCGRSHEVAPLAATLAVCAWVDGDGAAARVAVDRALEQDPAYSLAALVSAALDAGEPPSMWTAVMAQLSEDDILGEAGVDDESWSA
jgi:hypothetical protein